MRFYFPSFLGGRTVRTPVGVLERVETLSLPRTHISILLLQYSIMVVAQGLLHIILLTFLHGTASLYFLVKVSKFLSSN